MGRPAKPTAIKILEDNPGQRPLNFNEPKPKGLPKAPSEMSDLGKKVWRRIVASMPAGVYSQADEGMLMAYCEAAAQHREATDTLKRQEKVVRGSTGQMVVSPWIKIQSDAARLLVQLGSKLGLDPVSRQTLSLDDDLTNDDGDDVVIH